MNMSLRSPLIEILAWADWDNPPEQMNCSLPFHSLIAEIRSGIHTIEAAVPLYLDSSAFQLDAEKIQQLLSDSIRLYVTIPALINVMLNYKICVEHGLPLHPTVYYELKEARKYRIQHSLGAIQEANELYWKSIEVAQSCVQCQSESIETLDRFFRAIPPQVASFVYTAVKDRYTWMGSEPALLENLASKIKKKFSPSLIIAAAHGAIMPALVLALELQKPVYFIRFSMFKRQDEEPIVSLADQAWLFDYRNEPVLFYDEDVAAGRTLELFTKRLSPLFREVNTASSIRHAGSAFTPDFVGRIWWE